MSNITITTTKAKFPGNLADEYLALKAKMAELKKQETQLQDKLAAVGQSVIEGNFGRVSISRVPERFSIDYRKAAEENLKPSLLEKYCTKYTRSSVRFAVKARRGNEKIAA